MSGSKNNDEMSVLLSKQLKLELNSFYLYMTCASLCDTTKIASKSLKKYFESQYHEELAHAKGIIEHMNMLGLKINFESLTPHTSINDSCSTLDLLKISLDNELKENEHINETYRKATEFKDFATCQFLDAYVKEQLVSIKELKDLITIHERSMNGTNVNIHSEGKDGSTKK